MRGGLFGGGFVALAVAMLTVAVSIGVLMWVGSAVLGKVESAASKSPYTAALVSGMEGNVADAFPSWLGWS